MQTGSYSLFFCTYLFLVFRVCYKKKTALVEGRFDRAQLVLHNLKLAGIIVSQRSVGMLDSITQAVGVVVVDDHS